MTQSSAIPSAGRPPYPPSIPPGRTTARRVGLCTMLLALAVHDGACDGGAGGGCTDCAGAEARYPDPPPPGGSVQADVVRVRLTQHALDFLARQLGTLATALLPIERHDGRDRIVLYLSEELLPPGGPVSIRGGCLGAAPDECAQSEGTPGPTFSAASASKLALDVASLSDSLRLSWLEPDETGRPGVRIRLEQVAVYLDLVLALRLEGALPAAACHLQDEDGRAAVQLNGFGCDLRLAINPGEHGAGAIAATVQNLVVDLGSTTEAVVAGLRVTPCDGSVADPSCSDALCALPGASCSAVCGVGGLFGELGGFLNTVLEPVLSALAPMLGEKVGEIMRGMLANMPLSLQAGLEASDLLGPAFADVQPLYVMARASQHLTLRGQGRGTGLDVALDLGFAAQPHPCVVDARPPDLTALTGPPPDYSGFVEILDRPGGTHFERYHLAASVSQAAFAQLGWQLYQGGLFCLQLDSYDVAELVGPSFSLNAGLVMSFDGHLTGLADPDAPIMVSLRAQRQPFLRLGSGRPAAEGTGEPILEVSFDDLALGIYMLVDGAMLRLSAVEADLVVKLGVLRTPEQSLELVVQEIAAPQIEQVYNELAPDADVPGLVQVMMDVALGAVLGDDLHFELEFSDTLGAALRVPAQLRLNTVRTDLGPSGTPYLSVYATLCSEADMADAAHPPCYVEPTTAAAPRSAHAEGAKRFSLQLADEASLYVAADPARFPARQWLAAPSGRVELRVGSGSPAGLAADDGYAYQARVDGGPWGPFNRAPGGLLKVRSPRLLVVGEHEVQVRRRLQGQYMTRTGPERLSFWVDRVRPQLTVTRAGQVLHVQAQDLGTTAAQVQLWARWRGAQGPQPWWPASSVIPLSGERGAGPDQSALEIVARDLAGNSSEPLIVAVSEDPSVAGRAVTAADPALVSQPQAAPGCAAGRGATTGALLTAAVFMWLALRLRRS